MPNPRDHTVLLRGIDDDGHRIEIRIDLVLYVAQVLTPQLEDAQQPRCCFICLSVCIGTFKRDDCDRMVSHLFLHNHDFFAACIAFLAAPRTSADLPSLRAQLEENAARCPTADWHACVRQPVGDPLGVLLTALMICVSDSLWTVKPEKFFRAQTRRGRWPTAPEQLLPYGAQASVASYVFWCHALRSPFMVPLLVLFLRVARAEFIPALLAPPQKDVLMQTLVAMLQGAASGPVGPADDSDAARPLLRTDETGSPPSPVLRPQQAAAELLTAVHHDRGSLRLDDFAKLSSGHERPLYLALLSALAVHGPDSDGIHDDALRSTMSVITQRLHHQLALPPSAAQSAVDDRLLQTMNIPRREDVPLEAGVVFTILHRQAERKTCAGVGCREPARQACAHCKLVRYCGRACQRADWTVPRGDAVSVTHKSVCPVLRRLNDAGLFPTPGSAENDLQRLSQFFRRSGLPEADYRELFNWGVTVGLIPPDVLAAIDVPQSRSTVMM